MRYILVWGHWITPPWLVSWVCGCRCGGVIITKMKKDTHDNRSSHLMECICQCTIVYIYTRWPRPECSARERKITTTTTRTTTVTTTACTKRTRGLWHCTNNSAENDWCLFVCCCCCCCCLLRNLWYFDNFTLQNNENLQRQFMLWFRHTRVAY